MDSELVARDLTTNLGTIYINGEVFKTHNPADSLCVRVYRGSALADNKYRELHYSNDTAGFNFCIQIYAELAEYSIKVSHIRNAVEKPDTTIRGIVAGDVFMIEGQSNAFAMMRDNGSANSNKSEYIRTFGNADSSSGNLLHNLAWFRGEGDGEIPENGHVGQWGLRLARLLADTMKIPIAIFNGAFGGTPINYYARNADYKTNLKSNYSREYYRLNLAGLRNNVRAILWSQGETDAGSGTSMATYMNQFQNMENSWKTDYPGFKKIYIFQTRNNYSTTINKLMVIEEAQRELAERSDSVVEIIPTWALKQDSGTVHFDYKGGYEEFANRAYYLIARDLYGIKTSREVDAPMIKAAYMRDSTTLIVEENSASLKEYDTRFPFKDFTVEGGIKSPIDTIFLNKNKIIFILYKYPGSKTTVSCLSQTKKNAGRITNNNNIELVCFYQYPVADSIRKTTQQMATRLKVKLRDAKKNGSG